MSVLNLYKNVICSTVYIETSIQLLNKCNILVFFINVELIMFLLKPLYVNNLYKVLCPQTTNNLQKVILKF